MCVFILPNLAWHSRNRADQKTSTGITRRTWMLVSSRADVLPVEGSAYSRAAQEHSAAPLKINWLDVSFRGLVHLQHFSECLGALSSRAQTSWECTGRLAIPYRRCFCFCKSVGHFSSRNKEMTHEEITALACLCLFRMAEAEQDMFIFRQWQQHSRQEKSN